MKTRRTFTKQFKTDAVKLITEQSNLSQDNSHPWELYV